MKVSYDVGTQVDLLWTHDDFPQMLAGSIVSAGENGVRIRPEGGILPASGARVVLSLRGPSPVRVTAKVTGAREGVVDLQPSSYQHFSRRDYPRIDAPVALVYRLDDGGVNPAGLSDKAVSALHGWSRPLDSEVNLSVTGLAFPSPVLIPAGAILALRIRFPDADMPEMEVRGEVVRAERIMDPAGREDEGLGYRLAVNFVNLDKETRGVLTDYTLRTQNQALGIEDE